jgi:putative hydrolase of the HAD superfamily
MTPNGEPAAAAPKTIGAALFDYGGVLAEEGFIQGLGAVALAQGIDPEVGRRAGIELIHASGYIIGRGTEAQFWDMWRERTGVCGPDAELRAEVLSRFVLRPGMMAVVRALRRQQVLTAILSDQTDWLDRLEERDHFFCEFDKVYNSYRLGKTKRDSSVFVDVVQDLGVPPDQTLFVDDKPDHVERAQSRGLQALVFRDENGLLAELEARGIACRADVGVQGGRSASLIEQSGR